MSELTANILMPYWKQGYDLNRCIIEENDKINVKQTLKNYSKFLRSCAEYVDQIENEIPQVNDLTIFADTHFIEISGDKTIIQNLIDKNLVTKSDYEEENNSEEENN